MSDINFDSSGNPETNNINFDAVTVVQPHPVLTQNFPPVPPAVPWIGTGGGGSGINFPLAANLGGTGFSTYAIGDILYANSVSSLARLAATTNGFVLTLDAGLPKWAAIAAIGVIGGSGTAGKIPKFATAFTIGDSILSEAAGVINLAGELAISTTGEHITLTNSDVSNAFEIKVFNEGPGNGQLKLSSPTTGLGLRISHTGNVNIDGDLVGFGAMSIAGNLDFATITLGTWNGSVIGPTYGGTGQSTYAAGDILYASAIDTLATLPASTNGFVLTLSGGLPSWESVGAIGVVTSVSGTANRITSTGGTTPVIDISAAYIGQASITTLGTIATGVWNGTNIGAAKIADGTVSDIEFQFINTLSSNAQTQLDAKQALDSTLTALSGYNTNGILTQTAADTFVGRAITGTASRLSVTNGDGVSGNPTLNIDTGYVGQASITTLGTIATGVWNGTAIGPTFGGTGLTSYTAGSILYASASNVLSTLAASTNGFILTLVGGLPAWATPVATISGSGTAGKIPKFATGTSLGDSVMTELGGNIGLMVSPASDFNLHIRCPYGAAAGGGILIDNNLDEDMREALTIRAGLTTQKRRYIYFEDMTLAAGWLTGSNQGNDYILFSGYSGIHPILVSSSANMELQLNSGGTGKIIMNNNPGSGTGGFEMFSGGSVPAKILSFDPTNGAVAFSGYGWKSQSAVGSLNISMFADNTSAHLNSNTSLAISSSFVRVIGSNVLPYTPVASLGGMILNAFGDLSSPFHFLADIVAIGGTAANNSNIRFFTQESTGSGPIERARVTYQGNFVLGVDTAAARLHVKGSGTTTGVGFLFEDSGGTDWVTVLDNGKFGIGVSPTYRFDSLDNTASGRAGNFKQSSATGYGIIISPGADATYEALRIRNTADSITRHSFFGSGDVWLCQTAGSLGVGTAAPSAKVQIIDNSATASLSIRNAVGNGNGAQFTIGASRGSIASPADVQNTDNNASFYAEAYSGGTWFSAGSIIFMVDGTFTSGQRPPSAIIFGTNNANAAISERMRITSAGLVGIGVTPTAKFQIKGTGTGTNVGFLFEDSAGTDRVTILDNGLVGIGVSPTGNGLLQVKAGGSTSIAKVGGSRFDHFVDASVGGAESDIYTDTLDASILGSNGDKIIANYSGNFVTVGTELTQLKVYFAGTVIWDSTGIAVATGTSSWNVDVRIIRVSASVIRFSVTLNTTGASGFVYCTAGELTGLTLSGTNIIKLTGTSSGVGSGAGDLIGKSGYVMWESAS